MYLQGIGICWRTDPNAPRPETVPRLCLRNGLDKPLIQTNRQLTLLH